VTTIVTLTIDGASQTNFERLRQTHYPSELNQIAAHLTLFHMLPFDEATQATLRAAADRHAVFRISVDRVMTLGRGVAYAIESPELKALHHELSAAFKEQLSAQDRQGFRPHVVVQNKVSIEQAQQLRADLEAGFVAWEAEATGLSWWEYLGGPWKLLERMTFAGSIAPGLIAPE
jgi:2'-5' RNA ligase